MKFFLMMALLAGVLAALTVAKVRSLRKIERRVRPALGLCAECGFDLRASIGRCPECGCDIEPRKASDALSVHDMFRILYSDGWNQVVKRQRYRQFRHPAKHEMITLAGTIISKVPQNTERMILRQAGLIDGNGHGVPRDSRTR
jgi:predicted RNA binding protein YcfA (HicA-like mRNA interferase family)